MEHQQTWQSKGLMHAYATGLTLLECSHVGSPFTLRLPCYEEVSASLMERPHEGKRKNTANGQNWSSRHMTQSKPFQPVPNHSSWPSWGPRHHGAETSNPHFTLSEFFTCRVGWHENQLLFVPLSLEQGCRVNSAIIGYFKNHYFCFTADHFICGFIIQKSDLT